MAQPFELALVVFAKVPGLGIAKSRIAADGGPETAARAYDELLAATADTLRPFKYVVRFTGAADPGPLRDVFSECAAFMPQREGTLGERLHEAAVAALNGRADAFCAVGCDCPWMTPDDIIETRRALADGADVVLGPSEDGGYYLAGCRQCGMAIFEARGWSTPSLFDETMGIIAHNGLSCHLLPRRSDIDTLKDYLRWKDDT